ncbi:MAG: phosphonate C-P lyase system protein PhnH [Aquabacterium sp.]|nr:phosphonate C-P lyase system protein PhnH [Aquabacterium sp.]
MLGAHTDDLDVRSGWADPVADAQAVFRMVLLAMSFPGRIQSLPARVTATMGVPQVATPVAWPAALAAVSLCLTDADTPLYLHGTLDQSGARRWLKFHAGASACDEPGAAAFWLARASDLPTLPWDAMALGTDDAPQVGATLCVEVDGLADELTAEMPLAASEPLALRLRGPGIAVDTQATRSLVVAGLSRDMWSRRGAMVESFPRGFDLILTCGPRLAALPRTTRVELA